MTSTLVGYFDDAAEARRAAEHLAQSGFSSSDIDVVAKPKSNRDTQPEKEHSGFFDRLKQTFGFASEHERRSYEAAAREGGALLTITVPEERVESAADIIARHHPADLDERVQKWESTSEPQNAASVRVEEGGTVPVVEEELQVGKRAVRRGGIHVHQRVLETPVHEQVQLREETAQVERTQVDRPVTDSDRAFEARDISITETGEEPVVQKTARVVEEVSVSKEARERTEEVRDKVRKTEVDIDREEPKK